MQISQLPIDFIKGNIIHNLIAFSIPIVLGELLQNLYNSADALVVGNFMDENALAAVTVCGVISTLIVNFFNGMSVGTNVVVSRVFGAGDRQQLEHCICVSFTFSVIFGVVLSAAGIVFSPQLLNIAGTLPEYYEDALIYLRIYLAGLMFTVIYNSGAGILRAVGDSRTPFRILAITCGVNIVLDILLVAVFRLGIAGAGFATVFSQLLSSICAFLAINKKQERNSFNFAELHTGRAIIISVLDNGMAAGMQSALIGFSNLFVVRYMNMFDTASVAGIGIAQRLDKFVVLPSKSFGITMTTFVSQNLGAERYEQIKHGKQKCVLLAVAVTLVLSGAVYVLAPQCAALFNSEEKVVSVASDMMRAFLPLTFLVAMREVYLGVMRGYQKNFAPMVLSLIGMVGFRQAFLTLTMRESPAIENIYFCYPAAWIVTLALLLLYYRVIRKNLVGLNGESVPKEW